MGGYDQTTLPIAKCYSLTSTQIRADPSNCFHTMQHSCGTTNSLKCLATDPLKHLTKGSQLRNCLIMGTGRSGTSLLAGILAKSGWKTGDNYLASRDTNPSGFYEDRTVNRLNDRIIQASDEALWVRAAAAMKISPVRRGMWYRAPRGSPRLPLFDRSTVRRLVDVQPFAYKDPRFCQTYPAWRPYLPEGTVRVVTFRHPAQTVSSIMREQEKHGRLSLTSKEALAVWDSSYRQLLDWSRDSADWVFVSYERLVDGTAIGQLGQVLGADLNRNHVDATLNRSSSDGHVPENMMDLYKTLSTCSI